MQSNYERLFADCKVPDPHPELFNAICHRITAEQKRIVRLHVLFFSIGLVSSFIAVVPVFRFMQTSMTQSGFFEFFSLLFSDVGLVTTYWQSFFLILLESLPAVSIAAFLATVCIFFGSLRFLTRDVKLLYGSH